MVVRLLWLFSFAVCVCAREFIVMFDQMSHWKNLVELIGHCEDWAHVHRQGVQVTDFIVVDIAAEDYSCFRNATRVKHFGPNQMIRKNVLANEDKGRAGNDPVCVYKEIQAERLWNLGITGKGIRVAIFDTGLGTSHPHFSDQKIVIRTDWTNDGSAEDSLGHGTIVAGIIGADPKSSYSSQNCKGIAPDAELLIFKVFNSKKQSFTSWFLDAFNYALALGIDILNLSIGGPDFLDSPFVDKINELSANNIIVVSAIGNDGPTYGTLNNPADQMDVLGVGGVNENDEIAEFSSRGMTTWEISSGYGRVKPDIVTHSKNLMGSSKSGDSCKKLSGTSVASPIIAGALALLLSSVPAEKKDAFVNPAVARQILIESADLITSKDANIFEQGSGKLNLNQAYDLLKTYSPRVSAFPSNLNLVDNCPYFWPYCVQPLFKTRSPLLFNLTILNAIGVTGRILDAPVWMPDADFQDLLSIQFSYPKVFWPWTGYLSIKVGVNPNSNMSNEDHLIATGRIMLSVVVETLKGVQSEKLEIPVKVKVIATPPRSKRILWDQFHQLRYPSGFFPKDNLDSDNVLDWNGDHIHTNFKPLFDKLTALGYFVEVLQTDFTCIDPKLYGTLLMVDPEEEFFDVEIAKLEDDVKEHGLSLIVFAEWYNIEKMKSLDFMDQNTNSLWTPQTGGANIPALNDLLGAFGIELGDFIFKGNVHAFENDVFYSYGTSIIQFPAKGHILSVELSEITRSWQSSSKNAAILGLLDLKTASNYSNGGRIAVFGDSSCLDSSYMTPPDCYWLMEKLLSYVNDEEESSANTLTSKMTFLDTEFSVPFAISPFRRNDVEMYRYSKVIREDSTPACPSVYTSDLHFHRMSSNAIEKKNRYRNIPVRPPADFLPLDSFISAAEFSLYSGTIWICTVVAILFLFTWFYRSSNKFLAYYPTPLSDNTKVV